MSMKVIAVLLVSLCVVGTAQVYAGPRATKAQKFEHADKNDDGVIDKKEMKMERRFEAEQRSNAIETRSAVNTAVERKYDTNGDNVLDWSEAREMLKDKHILIKTEGKAKVDSALEAKYDTNQDGIIDCSEADALQADLQD